MKRLNEVAKIFELRSTGRIPKRIMRELLRAIRFMLEKVWRYLFQKEGVLLKDPGFEALIKPRLVNNAIDQSIWFEVDVKTDSPARLEGKRKVFETIKIIYAIRSADSFLAYN